MGHPTVPVPGPALPWAAPAPSAGGGKAPSSSLQQHPPLTDDTLAPLSIDQLGLAVGDRVEVLWQLEPDDGAPAYSRWWGATIAGPAEPPPQAAAAAGDAGDAGGAAAGAGAGAASSSGGGGGERQPPAYQLRYDPFDGFDEEVCAVQLLSAHALLDVRTNDALYWRRHGDAFEPPAEEEEADEDGEAAAAGRADGDADDEEGEEAEGGTVSVHQLASHISEAEVAAGEADLLADVAGAVGPAGQLRVAAGYRDFMESFKAFVAAKASTAAAPDGGLVITPGDVAEFKAMMATKRAAGGGGH